MMLKAKAVPLHATEALVGRRGIAPTHWTLELDGRGLSASRPGRALPPGERTPGIHCTGGWVGPRAGLDTEAWWKKILSPLLGIEPLSSGRPARSPELPEYDATEAQFRIIIFKKVKVIKNLYLLESLFSKILWLVDSFENVVLDIVYCLQCTWCTRRFGNFLYSRLQVIVTIPTGLPLFILMFVITGGLEP
jgi:hypothetical protein